MIYCKPVDCLMGPNKKLMEKQEEAFFDPKRYRWLVGKFIYLTIARLDLFFVVGVVSKFMENLCIDH